MTHKPLAMFDFDGVIADSLDYFFTAFRDACIHNGYEQIREQNEFLDLFDTNLYRGMEAVGIRRGSIQSILDRMNVLLESSPQRVGFFDGIGDMLSTLRATLPLYIITSNSAVQVSSLLTAGGLTLPREILGSEVSRSKVEKIRMIMDRHPEHQYYYVGDTLGDMIEALEAGARPLGVSWGWHPPEKLAASDKQVRIARDPQHLVDLIMEKE